MKYKSTLSPEVLEADVALVRRQAFVSGSILVLVFLFSAICQMIFRTGPTYEFIVWLASLTS